MRGGVAHRRGLQGNLRACEDDARRLPRTRGRDGIAWCKLAPTRRWAGLRWSDGHIAEVYRGVWSRHSRARIGDIVRRASGVRRAATGQQRVVGKQRRADDIAIRQGLPCAHGRHGCGATSGGGRVTTAAGNVLHSDMLGPRTGFHACSMSLVSLAHGRHNSNSCRWCVATNV